MSVKNAYVVVDVGHDERRPEGFFLDVIKVSTTYHKPKWYDNYYGQSVASQYESGCGLEPKDEFLLFPLTLIGKTHLKPCPKCWS